MARDTRRVRLGAGEYLYREHDRCPQVALVISGSVRVFKLGQAGREITLYHVHAGEVCLVNLLCAFLGSSTPAGAQVETPVEALVVPAERFRDWIRTNPAVLSYVFATIAKHVVDLMALVEEVAFQKMDRRLGQLLLERLAQPGLASGILRTTHEELAAELGSVREVVSRLLKDFERHGAITMARGRITLRDETALRQHCER